MPSLLEHHAIAMNIPLRIGPITIHIYSWAMLAIAVLEVVAAVEFARIGSYRLALLNFLWACTSLVIATTSEGYRAQ